MTATWADPAPAKAGAPGATGPAAPGYFAWLPAVPEWPYLTNSERIAFDLGAPWPIRGMVTGSGGGATSVGIDQYLEAGTYSFRHYTYTASYEALETFKIDGVTIGTLDNNVDPSVLKIVTFAGVVIATGGVKRLTIETPGPTHYYGGLTWWRTT